MSLPDDQIQALRTKLSTLGRDVNDKIIAVQAGKTLPAHEAKVPYAEPGEPIEESLKRFLGIVQSKMKATRTDESFGTCKSCQEPIAFHELEREPWRDLCVNCVWAGKTA